MNAAAPEDAPDDLILLRRYAQHGSQAAFTALVERHLGLVYAAALRQLHGAEHRAQDVAQSVFIDLARHASALTRREEIVGWLYTSTHYAAAKLKRTEQRRAHREQEAHAMHELDTPASAPDWDRLRPVLDNALLALPESDRAVILLRFFQQRRFADLGRQLGLSENTARMRLDRALEKLRAQLARRGIASTAAGLGVVLASQPALALPASLAASVAGAALAGASAGGSAIAVTTFFMTTKTTLTGAAAVLALGFAGYEFSQHRAAEAERAEAQAELATLARERDQLRARLGTEAQRITAIEEKNLALQQELERARTRTGAMGSGGLNSQTASSPSPTAGRMTFRAGTGTNAAEVRRKARQENLDRMDETYQALYRQLGFTPEQTARFRIVMADFYDRRREQMDVAMTQNPALDQAGRESLAKAIFQQANEEWRTTIRGAFGNAAAQTFQHYQEVLPAREVTQELAGLLFHSDAPLTLSQADRLVEVVAAHSRNARNDVDVSAMNNEAVLAQAQAFLSASQLAALRQAQFRVQWRRDHTASSSR